VRTTASLYFDATTLDGSTSAAKASPLMALCVGISGTWHHDKVFSAELRNNWLSTTLGSHEYPDNIPLHLGIEVLRKSPLSIELGVPDKVRNQHPAANYIFATSHLLHLMFVDHPCGGHAANASIATSSTWIVGDPLAWRSRKASRRCRV
jgi:hypothetical protein